VQRLIERVDQLLQQGKKVLTTRKDGDFVAYVDHGQLIGFRSAALSFIQRIYGEKHPHFGEFAAAVDNDYVSKLDAGMAILTSIREEIAGGWLFSMKGLISAEIFSDFLEMSEYFLAQGYKDPAAIMSGSVLEEHLRQLALKNEIPVQIAKDDKRVYKKADRLNADLAQKETYTKLDQKSVTAWLDLRNKAAHGKYDEYTKEQVALMIQGIIDFMTRNAI
jgi:uncharacterized protein (DUF2164 family)